MILLSTIVAQGQIKIGGNVYGGGNHANVDGSTNVRVRAGDINKVFGGARMANIGGNTYVNIDGKNALAYMIINYVYGGNDVAGTIGTAAAVGETLPTELTGNMDGVDNTWNSYVHLSTKTPSEAVYYTQEEANTYNTEHSLSPGDADYKTTSSIKTPAVTEEKCFIGQLFAGGNGDFNYTDDEGNPLMDGEKYIVTEDKIINGKPTTITVATSTTPLNIPELDKTYLDIQGGTIFFAHGGGNNATVREKTVIHVDNPSEVVTSITNPDSVVAVTNPTGELLTDSRIYNLMGVRMVQESVASDEFQIGRLFGGNNKAEMAIRPTWNLQSGAVRNLYSGGNRGNMTSPEGLLLEIKETSTIKVDNVYGGCRMADVIPTVKGAYSPCTNLPGYSFPNELSARTLIRGGDINNVYGGNDVTGTVYGGNAIGIYTSIRGDVYGGGNGAYAYTDMDTYENDETYGDFFYSTSGFSTTIDALNAFRPNAEQVAIRLKGKDAEHPTIIKGSVFCGGNCASLATKKDNPMVELKIGSHVIADKVFMGNNGEKMIDEDVLKHYAGVYPGAEGYSTLSTMKTDPSVFASYMQGVTMNLQPAIVFDSKANGDPDDYIDYTSKIGSLYCGGNVGSMAIAGKNTYSVDRGLIIFEKVVAGCNNADVEAGDYNPAYSGGILGAENERGNASYEYYTDNGTAAGKIKDRIELNLDNLTVEPRRWNDTFAEITAEDLVNGKLKAGEEYYTTNLRTSKFIADGTEPATVGGTNKYYKLITKGDKLDWNTALWSANEDEFMATDSTNTANDEKRRLLGGNVYGGCYNSGHVNGNVIININHDLIEKDKVFAQTDGENEYTISGARRSGVLREAQGDDVQAVAMTVFGAGYGEETEIWGSTTVNLNNGYTFQIFGGGEEGVVGKKNNAGEYVYDARYSSTVNMKGPNAGYSEKVSGLPLAETEYIYGGGNEGDVIGDAYVYLGNGRVYDAFGGASNADIYGGTEVYIGHNGGFPWVRDNVYGGNDFGGTIRGKINHTTDVTRTAFDAQMLQSATFVKYIQGRTDSIFGGNYGSYDYADPVFKDYTYSRGEESLPTGKVAGDPRLDGEGNPVFIFPHMVENSFVYFKPVDNSNNSVGYVFGGSEGFPGNVTLNDAMQEECYVLMDDTQSKNANRFANMDIYGGGAFAGTGTVESKGAGRTAVDLYAGSFHNVYGGCNQEGLVGYTRVNVPSGSTVKVNALFGGGKGYDPALFKVEKTKALAARYCDHYVTCVDYQSADAIVNDAIYGGNENSRIACDTYINITAPVMQSSGYQATIYGAGYGRKTLTGRTNVFMNNNSNAYKVFGGGRDGNTFNYVSMTRWLGNQFTIAGVAEENLQASLTGYGNILRSFGTYLAQNPISLPDKTGTYLHEGAYDGTYTNDILTGDYHQTNVHIMKGGNVSGYAYGGGYGKNAVVSGSTYIELKGGNVDKDVYGGGQGGIVMDEFKLAKDDDPTNDFVATTNVNIESGMCRNVYGGGYQGHTGKHCTVGEDLEITEAPVNTSYAGDVPAIANVVIGKVDGTSFYDGIPAIQRNAYGGGEGGSVYGTTNLTINNGYIGYRYKNTATSGAPVYEYVEELDDQKPNSIEKAGNAFGGGYVVNSYVDKANVTMYGGTIRGSLYGGGELGPIGAGTTSSSFSTTTGIESGNVRIFRPGKTQVKMYDGHVKRNVFGGGRGQDSWGGDGTLYMDEKVVASLRANGLFCKGYVFGQTEVDIYGGEVGTDEGVAQGYGNVFGGGDIGFVYSAYETEDVHYTQEEIDAAEVGDAAYGKTTSDIKTPGGLCVGKKPAGSVRYDGNEEGYYYKYENGAFVTSGSEKVLTEDCKVLVEPWCKALSAININSTDYAAGDFVPTSALNYLGNKADPNWITLSKADVNKEGVIIHNAVFAGGNTSPGSTDVYANTTTVYGNATASVHDVYNRDLISIGRGRVGGLYGDGNLTLVDGYRETNITNYGTDYYHINSEITLAEYNALPNREAAYYEIRYKCLQACTDKDGKNYAVGSTITADEMQTVFEGVTVGEPAQAMIQPNGKPLEAYWKENGVCSRYAGRPMNTVQRSDFCGVFGSRMVMMGAQDRVPETVDYTNYTINRVREVSLNKKTSVRAADASDHKNKEHGNYFGIYSVVNYLGALTSDVDFHTAKRVTDNSDATTYKCATPAPYNKAYETATYADWKEGFSEDRRRNNGTSHNKVALASGVYLELTTEKSTGTGLTEKDWGYITGVVELDLINVQPGMGGGYVYAKNEHGTRQDTHKDQTILTALNTGAATNKKFKYVNNTVSDQKEWETSGNFVHSTQTIIDDCYNIGGKYKVGESPVPAHYWFIKGAIYVYDQYISAYTGNPNAFSETVSIPLTITSASHGKMTLLNVMPNHYAYYSVNTNTTQTKLGENDKIELRDVQYGLNDAISYWDYSQLTAAEKKLFVPETYTVIADCTYGNGATPVTYKAGTVLLPSEYEALKDAAPTKKLEETDTDVTPYVHHVSRDQDVDIDYVFRPSNNVSHNTGYILTYNIDNPNQWNTWYTPKSGSASDKNQTGGVDYEDGPTYRLTSDITGGMVLGQNDYKVGAIISDDEYYTYKGKEAPDNVKYPGITSHITEANGVQAEFHLAYIVTADELETTNKSGTEQRLHKGATLSKENYSAETWSSMSSSVDEAFVVTKTIQLSKTEFIYRGTYMSEAEKESLASTYTSLATEINKSVVPAYYCTSAGKYGGNYYETGKNYRALAAFTSMSESDRNKFTFNYDALDLLIDPNYSKDPTTGNVIHAEGQKYQYDGENFTTAEQAATNKAKYSLATPIDYSATYKGDTHFTYKADDNTDVSTEDRAELTRTEYERLTNEQYYWAPITVATGKTGDYYVVKETIVLGDTPYAAGQVISSDTYSGLGDTDKQKVAKLNFTTAGTYYYCREAYTIQNNDKGHAVNSVSSGVTGGTGGNYSKSQTVPKGVIIDATAYGTLTNEQKNFSIHGLAPTETSSLFVTRGSDIFDLSAEKIITVIYQYDYVESDMTGTHITPVSERHILNIHLNFKSGVPTVEDIQAPDIILPGTMLSIPEPYVTPGAYEITGGGWKLFDTESDAESHINGVEYTPLSDPLYLYQNKHYLAYYAKTYLGETFSNHVPVHVANYHDLKKVMDDNEHHYYIDHKEIYDRLKVEPKIYINDYSSSSENGLDLFKNLYDLSLLTSSSPGVTDGKVTTEDSPLKDQYLLDKTRVGGAKNLEFILRTDIDHSSSSWTPIGTDDVCFKGTLHGDGHTISGLDHSLFRNLCGDVYNLGVKGSFNTAGVADLDTEAGVTKKGYVESCWVKTTSTTPLETKQYPVLGSPTDNKGYQLVNSYFLNDNSTLFNTVPANGLITYTNGSKGTARAMTEKEFYNGTVAYNLNNFYLHKRYSDKQVNSGQAYKYWKSGETEPRTGYYAMSEDLCSSGYTYTESEVTHMLKYVEDRFEDGDFRFAGGVIPDDEDERWWEEERTDAVSGNKYMVDHWSPIWPDDYIFFGQKLTYGYSATQAHQEVPTAVVKTDGHLSQNDDANRVYRAPAYFRSKDMSFIHFNPQAYLAQKSSDGTKEVYPGLTAIDFAGHYDTHTPEGPKAYELGMNDGKFYAPLLDDGGLTGITNYDETRNLLVYAPSETSDDGYANKATYDVLTGYFTDPAYSDYYSNPTTYRNVADATSVTSSIYGHLVMDKKIAKTDHLLVDKEDFNCPIAYTFDGSHRMWYQRTPEDQEYVDLTKGWQGISIPFTAELVTTNDKGEITHFYSGSATSANSDKKIGHEYWLREFDAINKVPDSDPEQAKASFLYPTATGSGKTVTNHFLWDYYYEKSGRKDKNSDIYQEYYRNDRPYASYPLLTGGTPYILGLPGKTYYEFDLSGNFTAQNTYAAIDKLGKQTITFASNTGVGIGVSDDETAGVEKSLTGTSTTFNFTFKPSYMNMSLAAGTDSYTLDADGDSYDKVPASGDATKVSAFRPYFIATSAANAGSRKMAPERILFGGDFEGLEGEPISTLDGDLEIYVKDHKVVTTSHLKEATTVRIISVSGVTMANYVLQPGETRETPIRVEGAYIVNKKKLLVK